MRECRSPKDWSLLALQNTRTGKSHYLVICRCPDHFKMEGPMAHDQPTYASVPRVYVSLLIVCQTGYSVRKPSSQPPKLSLKYSGPGYRRNNEPIEAATEVDNKLLINTSTQATEETKTTLSEDTTKAQEDVVKREKRSLSENTIEPDDDVPEFPWDRVIEFEKTVVWD
ncbi:hypothetical protein DOY81_013403 [Sarcophaga bullata]|nr:hypothetical protein DOY81_013403 [Sarcophaga bullata]